MFKIHKYIFLEILKGFLLIFFIFLSISWLLQFTRLVSLTNLIQVDIFTIFYLSFFLIPNLITIITPFVIMFGLVITFIKLHKDRELISIYSLGLNIKSVVKPIIYFSIIILSILVILNFYYSPKIYKDYKIKEYEIRNTISFEKIVISNFIEINNNTYLDFKKDKNKFTEVFIKFFEKKHNLIYAKEANITQNDNKFIFNLFNGFKITLIEDNEIEKLEFDNYNLEIINKSYEGYDNFDNNTFNIFEDIKNKNYVNIFYKITDCLIVFLIIIFFYFNNIKTYNLNIANLFVFIIFSSIIIIMNQILRNSELDLLINILFVFSLFIIMFLYLLIRKRYV